MRSAYPSSRSRLRRAASPPGPASQPWRLPVLHEAGDVFCFDTNGNLLDTLYTTQWMVG